MDDFKWIGDFLERFGFPTIALWVVSKYHKVRQAKSDSIIKAKDEQIKSMYNDVKEIIERDVEVHERQLESDLKTHNKLERLIEMFKEWRSR